MGDNSAVRGILPESFVGHAPRNPLEKLASSPYQKPTPDPIQHSSIVSLTINQFIFALIITQLMIVFPENTNINSYDVVMSCVKIFCFIFFLAINFGRKFCVFGRALLKIILCWEIDFL